MTLQQLLIEHEGLRLKPYRCSAGKLTIGVGRNLDDVGLTTDEALILLDNDIKAAMRDAASFSWFKKLDDARQAVVVDMIFNLGIARFKGFKKTIAHIEAGHFAAAAHEMLNSSWAKQVGRRAVRLSKIMRTGVLE